ncbi:uncharacterized protein HMPREF1541_01382 [Cyphellophora europaea CBS 101466]|uniref:Glutathione S-transferase n=1 Tax=Cyphellophora europaea (strain CBS 101466) TaxID=1220924 RepID=W2SEN0_CYPE1|nr:uncharacterized protein HMPREF1541_01382 [Cyphellophora europaea CBS 101466]ETN47191.1 hypothetical protein HMPREF1541_01382 [Cyphellophora europaea CBS 101466]
MATTRSSKRQKNEPYELLYHAGIPGRGEHIRLAFEEAGVEYWDAAHNDNGASETYPLISDKYTGNAHSPPHLAPPILRHGDLTISQTPNILLYLGPRLGLVPDQSEDPEGIYYINQLTLTALDGFSNEAHDTHHPIASGEYYEDQKDEALRRAVDYRLNRIPKFLGYFERVLGSPTSQGGEYLYGGKLSYADLVLFQTLDGVSFAFPKCVKSARESGKYGKVWALYERVKGRAKIKEYLASDRRLKYSMGIYRHYPELDEE